jgi:hypothetical protein
MRVQDILRGKPKKSIEVRQDDWDSRGSYVPASGRKYWSRFDPRRPRGLSMTCTEAASRRLRSRVDKKYRAEPL